jgi:hypothetical protein
MAEKEMPRLVFTEEWDEYAADLAEMKGWCGIGVVELPDDLVAFWMAAHNREAEATCRDSFRDV